MQHYVGKCACGYERPSKTVLETDNQVLKELKKVNKEVSKEDKSRWLGELQVYAYQKNYKQGWASWAYRSKFGVWPNKITPERVNAVSPETKSYIQHLNIRRSKRAV